MIKTTVRRVLSNRVHLLILYMNKQKEIIARDKKSVSYCLLSLCNENPRWVDPGSEADSDSEAIPGSEAGPADLLLLFVGTSVPSITSTSSYSN